MTHFSAFTPRVVATTEITWLRFPFFFLPPEITFAMLLIHLWAPKKSENESVRNVPAARKTGGGGWQL